MQAFQFQSPTKLVFGEGSLDRLGELSRELGFRRTLLCADQGMAACGYVERATRILASSGIAVFPFHDFDSNPDSSMIERGRDFAETLDIDSIIGLGGGSSMDTAKGINFLLTNGGRIQDYWGHGKAGKPMLPMIGVPTTAGTGSEAQSYALISDADTHVKMACGDPKAAFLIALLDPLLTLTLPAKVTATAGFDAISHAVETYVTTKRSPVSMLFSKEAWRLLENNYEQVLAAPDDVEARAAMLLGAYYAGVAIDSSMLGATHACANPLTTHYGTDHGIAISLLLPHVVRWNSETVNNSYEGLLDEGGGGARVAARLEELRIAGGLPRRLSSLGIAEVDLPMLAEEAALQWTGKFNPRPFGAAEALEVYKCAY